MLNLPHNLIKLLNSDTKFFCWYEPSNYQNAEKIPQEFLCKATWRDPHQLDILDIPITFKDKTEILSPVQPAFDEHLKSTLLEIFYNRNNGEQICGIGNLPNHSGGTGMKVINIDYPKKNTITIDLLENIIAEVNGNDIKNAEVR